MVSKLVAVTKVYDTGNPASLIVIIPAEVRKRLNIKKGQRVAVYIDGQGRIIYERIHEAQNSQPKLADSARVGEEDDSKS